MRETLCRGFQRVDRLEPETRAWFSLPDHDDALTESIGPVSMLERHDGRDFPHAANLRVPGGLTPESVQRVIDMAARR